MNMQNQEYELGKDVTNSARSKTARDTAVVSVRLPVEDVARLERLCHQTGKSMSQIVREAIHGYHAQIHRVGYSMMVGTSSGVVFTLGDPIDNGQSQTWQVEELLQG